MSLAGKVALVTGGASGIGRATVRRLAAAGARVAIADVDVAAAAVLAEELGCSGGEVVALECDVRDEGSVAAAVARVRETFGTLHILITSAGILQGAFEPVMDLDAATFERVLDVNLRGTFLCCKHAAPLIEASGGGVILCLASAGGVTTPSSSLAYGASKAGVHGFCLTLAGQLRPRGIRVNVVCPGSLDTPMKRQNLRDRARAEGRDPEQTLAETPLGDPDGVSRILAWLASEDADYVEGTLFTR